ncbi:unnamed protein product [Meloidogyne enterolobii]|uniref:Uncharacterized protein n=1 Tax=Meloidogyne enterolobii TaxID=390850 RepID=A0ACB0XUY6_MELEN
MASIKDLSNKFNDLTGVPKILDILPLEIQIDILKCLDYNQLTTLQQTNSQIHKLIKHFENKLARRNFSVLKIGSDHDMFSYSVPMIRYPITEMVYDFQPSKELEQKWEIALNNQIPMYFYLNEDDRNVYVIAESNTCFYRFELFKWPNKIDHFIFARHCFELLSHCHFNEIIFERIVFNPQIFNLIFDDLPIKLNCNIARLLLNNIDYDNQALEVVKNNLVISKMLSFRFIWAAFTTLYEVDKYIFLNFLLNGGANIPLASIYYIGSAIELHKEVIKFAETSLDCSKMVNSIEFQRLEWSMPKFSSRVKLIRQKEYIKGENQHIFLKYETSNVHNSNLVFYIFIWKEVKAETIHRFRIQKLIRASIGK